ncbi:GerW family sporulation protein [Candidatus Riflebacteria bacterium]
MLSFFTMAFESIIKSILNELNTTISSKTVIGEPIKANEQVIIPVTKTTFGFGIGGGKSNPKDDTFGGGTGGGGTVEPVAFIAVGPKDEIQVFSVKTGETVWERLLTVENFEKLYEKIKEFRGEKKGKNSKNNTQKKEPPPDSPDKHA